MVNLYSQYGLLQYPFFWTFQYSSNENNSICSVRLPPIEILKYLFKYHPDSGNLYQVKTLYVNSENRKCFIDCYLNLNPDKRTYNNSVEIIDSVLQGYKFNVADIAYYLGTGIEPLDGVSDNNKGKFLKLKNLELINGENMCSMFKKQNQERKQKLEQELKVEQQQVDTSKDTNYFIYTAIPEPNSRKCSSVFFDFEKQKWTTFVYLNNIQNQLGFFNSRDEASEARQNYIKNFVLNNPI